MYLNVTVLFVILSYQCLMISSMRFGMRNFRSDVSSKSGVNDCFLPMPNKNDLKSPKPTLANYILHPTSPPYNGHLNVKHNSLFKLTCGTGKILTRPTVKRNTKEIFVKCVKGNHIEYYGKTYNYKDFKCIDSPTWNSNTIDKKYSYTISKKNRQMGKYKLKSSS